MAAGRGGRAGTAGSGRGSPRYEYFYVFYSSFPGLLAAGELQFCSPEIDDGEIGENENIKSKNFLRASGKGDGKKDG